MLRFIIGTRFPSNATGFFILEKGIHIFNDPDQHPIVFYERTRL